MKVAIGIELSLLDQSIKPEAEFSSAIVVQRDPQKITDLIKQLERDLVETKKNTSKPR